MIADDLRSSAITITGSQTITEVCFHMIADDRRPYCDLRSAIRDHMETSLYAYLKLVPNSSHFQINKIRHFYDKTSRSIRSIADIMMTADIIIYFVCKRQK